MPSVNCKINLSLICSANCVISNVAVNQAITFAINDTKLFFIIVTLLTQDHAKLLQQLKSRFKRASNNTSVKLIFRLLN